MPECNNCGHTVSANAWECPQCGSQTPNTSVTVAKVLLVAFVVGLILMLIVL